MLGVIRFQPISMSYRRLKKVPKEVFRNGSITVTSLATLPNMNIRPVASMLDGRLFLVSRMFDLPVLFGRHDGRVAKIRRWKVRH